MLSCFLSLLSLGVCLGNEMADSLTSPVSLIFRAVLLVRIPVIYYGADNCFSEHSPLVQPLNEDLIVHSLGVLAVMCESFFLLSVLFWTSFILLLFITLPSQGSQQDWSKQLISRHTLFLCFLCSNRWGLTEAVERMGSSTYGRALFLGQERKPRGMCTFTNTVAIHVQEFGLYVAGGSWERNFSWGVRDSGLCIRCSHFRVAQSNCMSGV